MMINVKILIIGWPSAALSLNPLPFTLDVNCRLLHQIDLLHWFDYLFIYPLLSFVFCLSVFSSLHFCVWKLFIKWTDWTISCVSFDLISLSCIWRLHIKENDCGCTSMMMNPSFFVLCCHYVGSHPLRINSLRHRNNIKHTNGHSFFFFLSLSLSIFISLSLSLSTLSLYTFLTTKRKCLWWRLYNYKRFCLFFFPLSPISLSLFFFLSLSLSLSRYLSLGSNLSEFI